MVEMREFKQVAGKVVDTLVAQGRLQPQDLSKGVMETAQGVRMWQSLRVVSDTVLFERIAKNPHIWGQGLMPTFKLTPLAVVDSVAPNRLTLPKKD